ncbi:hypothetical protein OAK75_01765 [Bacteriovoracales bacterium]|nr:hypothetical protein [Bacteriovoracales bacterium]
MRLIKFSFILGLFLICYKGMAQADFAKNKADDLSRVKAQLNMLNGFKDCLQKASGMLALRDCHKNNKVRRKNLNKDQRKSMMARRKKEIEDKCTHRRIKSKRNISMERCVEEEMKRMRRHKRGRMGKGRGRGKGRGKGRGRMRGDDRGDMPFEDDFQGERQEDY